MKRGSAVSVFVAMFVGVMLGQVALAQAEFLNASYDPTRELYQEFNQAFGAYWKEKTGVQLTLRQSHGGSGSQARAVIGGLEADVVTLALAYDIDAIVEKAKLLPENWQTLLPDNSSPYVSTVVFLVRKGNPKGIKDWDDLVKPGIEVITPNPKTSGGARWNYLAAWGHASEKFGGDKEKITDFMKALFKNVPVLDSAARGATTTFVQRGIGDVFLAWENEALLALREIGVEKVELVIPSVSILAEPSVAIVTENAKKHGTTEIAEAYLRFLYSETGQDIAARHYYRPRLQSVADKYKEQFPDIKMFTIDQTFGGWKKAQQEHFSDGGTFDQIYQPGS